MQFFTSGQMRLVKIRNHYSLKIKIQLIIAETAKNNFCFRKNCRRFSGTFLIGFSFFIDHGYKPDRQDRFLHDPAVFPDQEDQLLNS